MTLRLYDGIKMCILLLMIMASARHVTVFCLVLWDTCLGSMKYLYSVIKLLVTVYIGVRCNCCLFLDEMSEFLNDLQKLIESSYEDNGNQPVILLGHSMGNLYIHYLLTHQSRSWKEKYIKSFISLAGPWGGAVKTIRLEISGRHGSFVVNVGD